LREIEESVIISMKSHWKKHWMARQ
jgi:hypothetical protein